MEADDVARSRRNQERLNRLRLLDDELLRVALQDRPDLSQDILRTLTGLDDIVLEACEVQRDEKMPPGARSAMFDMHARDTQGRRFNMEVERSAERAIPKRARYHSSVMDVEALAAGKAFSKLPESYVVFVTEEDYFGRGEARYRFDRVDVAADVVLADKAHVVYVNGAYRGDDALGRLMHDFSCSDPDDMSPGPLADRVREIKEGRRGASQMGWFTEEVLAEGIEIGMERGMERGMEQGMEQGMERGLERGRKQGLERGRLEALAELVRDGAITTAVAAERMGVTPEQFTARVAEDGLAVV